ncbi:unnamed protein product [Mytilus coruscus]|uniref:Reverse transcriptase domain-containing protein n=1 Tax=Mytilus coruscus TaxID=42192 RepID=A0A6J8AK24_MYTCO|nr:unnamed protein product [Mytilus coruscus]
MLNFLSRTIDISDYEMCESDITFDEICRSVNGMKKGKTPGPDGLTCEFYCKFINEFKDIFFHVFNCIENEGQLSRSMRHSVINLIFKKKGDKNDIKSYRPITLANVDYKILARIMANRLKLTLTKIISNTQTCSVIGRDISDTVCSIINVIDLIDEEELQAYILKTDQEKAFDRVSHEFLFSVLEKFGFGERFRKWITIFYTNVRSSVKCNDHLTPYYSFNNGIKQGCPLSSILYTIVSETLDRQFYKTQKLLHADDTTFSLANRKSIFIVFDILKIYSGASGAKINKKKSEILILGNGYLLQNDIEQLGITKVKHLTYEVIPGFLNFIAIHEILSEKDADLKYDDVCKFYRNVLVSLPPEWVHFINENINPVSKNFEITADCFSFSVEDKEVPMPQKYSNFL